MQQAVKHYSRAPITEAILDLKVILPDNFPIEKFLEIHARIRDRFPTSEPIHVGSLSIQAGPEIQVDASRQHSGFLFRSKDGLRIFQATLQGFTFNRLAPYNSWEEFSDDARNLWEIYKDICKPAFVTRAAIRYINRIDIPVEGPIKLQDYLKSKGISTGIHYPIALPNLRAYSHMNHRETDFPVATKASQEILSLPMFPELEEAQIAYIAKEVKEFMNIHSVINEHVANSINIISRNPDFQN